MEGFNMSKIVGLIIRSTTGVRATTIISIALLITMVSIPAVSLIQIDMDQYIASITIYNKSNFDLNVKSIIVSAFDSQNIRIGIITMTNGEITIKSKQQADITLDIHLDVPMENMYYNDNEIITLKTEIVVGLFMYKGLPIYHRAEFTVGELREAL
jgi:hypothetical protein